MTRQATAALFVSCAALAACHKAPPLVQAEPEQRLQNLTLSQSQNGQTLWTLDADKAVLADAHGQALINAPHMSFYKDGKLASRLKAEHGQVELATNDVTLSSGVVVNSLQDGSTLQTSELLYSSTSKKFHTDRDVVVRRPGAVVRGRGLEAAPDLSELRIFHQRAVLQGKEGLE